MSCEVRTRDRLWSVNYSMRACTKHLHNINGLFVDEVEITNSDKFRFYYRM
jgi:hypothetical protein